MAWIELHDTLPDHDKVLDVAEALDMDKDLVVGKLVRLWTWALNNREDGFFKSRDIDTIAEVMRFKGPAKKLVSALVAAKLLDSTDTGYVIHDWEERVGMLLARREQVREQTRDRVRRFREKRAGNTSVTDCNALGNALQNENCNACNAGTVPYRTNDDDDDDDEDSTRVKLRYADVGLRVRSAFAKSFGRPPTNEEMHSLTRGSIINKLDNLIEQSIEKAAAFGAKSVVSYINEMWREWKYYCIETEEDLQRFEAKQLLLKSGSLSNAEFQACYNEIREAKRGGGG